MSDLIPKIAFIDELLDRNHFTPITTEMQYTEVEYINYEQNICR